MLHWKQVMELWLPASSGCRPLRPRPRESCSILLNWNSRNLRKKVNTLRRLLRRFPPDDVRGLLLQHRGLLWPEAGADEGEAPGGQTQVAVAAAGVAAERLAVPVAESLP